MKVYCSTIERYPEFELVKDSSGYEMSPKLYKEYVDALKAFNKVQYKIEKWEAKLQLSNYGQATIISGVCGSCA